MNESENVLAAFDLYASTAMSEDKETRKKAMQAYHALGDLISGADRMMLSLAVDKEEFTRACGEVRAKLQARITGRV